MRELNDLAKCPQSPVAKATRSGIHFKELLMDHMRGFEQNRLSTYLLLFFVLFPMFVFLYLQGRVDGVRNYKQSRQFAMTLESAYLFGTRECK